MRSLLILLLLVLALPSLAAAADKTATDSKASTDNKTAKPAKTVNGLNTNVIGSQEAPSVLNVVPWKDQAISLKQQAPTTRLLGQVLQPLDVNVLDREVEYYRLLNKKSSDNDMFLSQ